MKGFGFLFLSGMWIVNIRTREKDKRGLVWSRKYLIFSFLKAKTHQHEIVKYNSDRHPARSKKDFFFFFFFFFVVHLIFTYILSFLK